MKIPTLILLYALALTLPAFTPGLRRQISPVAFRRRFAGSHKATASHLIGLWMFAAAIFHPSCARAEAGDVDAGFDPSTDSEMLCCVLQSDGRLLIGGYFQMVNGESHPGIARLNTDGSVDETFVASTDANDGGVLGVFAVAVQTNGKIVIGGDFASVDGVGQSCVARLNSDGTLDGTFAGSASATVRAITLQPNGAILIGGDFTNVDGATANYLARLNTTGGLDTTFDVGTGFNGDVRCIALQSNGEIVVGGDFTTLASGTYTRIARLDANGSVDTSFASLVGADNTVHSIAIQSDGKLLFAGNYENIDGVARAHLARLNTDASLDTSFVPGYDDGLAIYSILLQPDEKILIGGDFGPYDGVEFYSLARANPDGSADTTFNAGNNAVQGGHINSVILQTDGKIIIGGSFAAFNGVTRSHIARLFGDGSSGVFNLSSSSYNTTENAGSVTLTVQRTGGSAGAVSVDYFEDSGTATAGLDFQPTSGTLTWADGDSTDKIITIPINDRGLSTGDTVYFFGGLTNATGGATLGTIPTATVSILDGDAPQPTITITSPPNNLTVVAGATVPFAASVVDPGGILTQVQFLVNNVPVFTTTGAGPYVYNATAPPLAGTYTVEAIATGTLGRVNTSTVTVSVIEPSATAAAPSAGLLTPVAGLNLAAGSTVTLNLAATADTTTALQSVSLYANGVLIASFDGSGTLQSAHGTGRPTLKDATGSNVFQTTYTLPPGIDQLINIIAVALDSLGQSTVSSVATVHSTVTTDAAPLVALGGLADGADVLVGSMNPISVTASDPDAATMAARPTGPVRQDAGGNAILSQLAYFFNGLNIGTSATPPYGFTFNPPTPGKYVLDAVATDGSGLSTVSDPVIVEAVAPPTVTVAYAGDGLAEYGVENGKVAVRLASPASTDVTVSYKVKGAAKVGIDYKPVSGTVTIPAGSVQAKIKIKPLEDPANTGTLVAKVKLLPSADGSYTLGDTTVAKIKIVGNQ